MIAGFGLIIAALAELLGLSVAIGAFFAGLIFSRDPETVKLDTPFGTLYGFFTPFFFLLVLSHPHPALSCQDRGGLLCGPFH